MTGKFQALETSEQAKDVRSSKGPTDIWKGYARVKAYVKPEDWGISKHVRDLPFDQPFQVASERTGLDWNICNRVYLGQLVGCNLRCPYCFVDQEHVGTVEVGPVQYCEDFTAYNDEHPPAGVLRFSGGEPMLQGAWLSEAVAYGLRTAFGHLWVDTNLTIPPGEALGHDLRDFSSTRVGICGCFKPGIDGANLDEQMRVAEAWLKAGADLYLYWPSWPSLGEYESEQTFQAVLGKLRDLHPGLPLRLTVIYINWNYAAMRDRKGAVPGDAAALSFINGRQCWRDWVKVNCPRELLHLPSHQVPIR